MTHFTILWLGQAISAAVYALVSVLPGSAVLGNIFFDTSIQATPAIYVNAQQVLNPTAGGLSFPSNGTQSGVTLVDGATNLQTYHTYSIPFTATGGEVAGGVTYDTAVNTLPWTGSGVVTGYSVECKTAELSIVGSGGIVRGAKQVITVARSFPNLVRTFGTGSSFGSSSGYLLTRSGDSFKFGTRTTISSTVTAPDCRLFITGKQTYNTR